MVKATGRFRVMAVTAPATGLLKNLQLTDGRVGPNDYGGGIFSQGGSLALSFDTLSGRQGLITGGGFATATGTILDGSGTTPNRAGPLSETAGYNLSTDSSCGLSLKTGLIGVTRGSGHWRTMAGRR